MKVDLSDEQCIKYTARLDMRRSISHGGRISGGDGGCAVKKCW